MFWYQLQAFWPSRAETVNRPSFRSFIHIHALSFQWPILLSDWQWHCALSVLTPASPRSWAWAPPVFQPSDRLWLQNNLNWMQKQQKQVFLFWFLSWRLIVGQTFNGMTNFILLWFRKRALLSRVTTVVLRECTVVLGTFRFAGGRNCYSCVLARFLCSAFWFL